MGAPFGAYIEDLTWVLLLVADIEDLTWVLLLVRI